MTALVRVCACKTENWAYVCRVRRYRRACASVCVACVWPLWGGTALVSSAGSRREIKKETRNKAKEKMFRCGLLASKPFGRLPSGLCLSVKLGPQFAALLCHRLSSLHHLRASYIFEGREMRTRVGHRPPGQACRGCTEAIPANKVRRW